MHSRTLSLQISKMNVIASHVLSLKIDIVYIKSDQTCIVKSGTRIHLKHAIKKQLSIFSASFILLIALKLNPGQVSHSSINWYSPSGSIRCVNYTTNWCVIAVNNCCFEMRIRCFNYGVKWPLWGTVVWYSWYVESNDDISRLSSVTSERLWPLKWWISMRDQLDVIELIGPEAIISAILISDSFSNTDAPQALETVA